MKKSKRLPIGLFSQIREDWITNGRRWSHPGFQALAVYRYGVWTLEAIPSRLVRAPFTLLYNLLFISVRNFYGIELPRDTQIGRRLMLLHQNAITIHHTAQIGDDCGIRHNVTIGVTDRNSVAPKLGDRVEVGAGAVLFGEIQIGDDVRIGPNAVVSTNVPSGSVVAALPPRILKARIRTCSERGAARALRQKTTFLIALGAIPQALSLLIGPT